MQRILKILTVPVLLGLMCLPQPTLAEHPDDIYWEGDFHYPGIYDGTVEAMVEYNGQLVVAGRFSSANGVVAANIAAWDGSQWTALATTMTSNSYYPQVLALTVFDGKLITGGHFDSINGMPMQAVAAWNGTNWAPMGNGLYCTEWGLSGVFDFAVHNGQLVAGGVFTMTSGGPTANVASWNGSSWSAVGCCLDNNVYDIMDFNGVLVIGGDSGSIFDGGIGYFNGSHWMTFGGELERLVLDMVTLNGSFYVRGAAVGKGGESYVARWDDPVWTLIANGDNGSRGTLFVNDGKLITSYRRAGSSWYDWFLAEWNGTSWDSIAPHPNSTVYSLAAYDGKLFAGGAFTEVTGQDAFRVASWDGSSWDQLGTATGVGGSIYAMETYGDQLIVGGSFHAAGEEADANHIAAWNGAWWTPLGTGLDDWVTEMVPFDGAVIASGDFTQAGGSPASRIAAWDGMTWSALGSGVNGDINDLLLYNDQLLVAGNFDTAGAVAVANLAAWDGTTWSAVDAPDMQRIYGLTEFQGQLLALGGHPASFWPEGPWTIGEVKLATYNGSEWTTAWSDSSYDYGSGFQMFAFGDTLCLFNYNDTVAGMPYFAGWDGTTWFPLGGEFDGQVNTASVFQSRMIVSGYFEHAGGVEAHHIAGWDGSTWSALGSGLSGAAFAFADYYGELFIGGYFVTAGDKATQNLAAWNPGGVTCCREIRGDVTYDWIGPDVADLTYLVGYLFNAGPPPPCEEAANVDGQAGSSGAINVSDLTYLVGFLFQGGPPPPGC